MPAPLLLPRIAWGSSSASRRALLVHGLGSSGALMWRLGDALADAGWHATAVDLRGHGDAPRSLDYSVAAYAADLAATRPSDGGSWDAVIGHSLGGAASTVAAASDSEWTRRLVLIDPAIHVNGRDAGLVRRSQERAFADTRLDVVIAVEDDDRLALAMQALTALRSGGFSAEIVASGSPRKRFDKAAKIPAHALIAIGTRDGATHVNVRGDGARVAAAEAIVRAL